MRIGLFSGTVNEGTIDDVVAEARQAEADGFSSFWTAQIFGHDALTVLAIVGREVPRIELGTSVVPTYPRHPMMLAQQALSVNAAAGGRLCLGIGLSHQIVIESMLGMSFDKPVRHMREYLSVLGPLSRGEPVAFTGEDLPGERGRVGERRRPVPHRRRRARAADAQGRRRAGRRDADVVHGPDDPGRLHGADDQRRRRGRRPAGAAGDRRAAGVRHRRRRRRPRPHRGRADRLRPAAELPGHARPGGCRRRRRRRHLRSGRRGRRPRPGPRRHRGHRLRRRRGRDQPARARGDPGRPPPAAL